MLTRSSSVAVAVFALAAPARAAEDAAAPAPAFAPGDQIGFKEIAKLEAFLPKEFWNNRDFFFYEGMNLEIGPFDQDYSPSKEHIAATERYRGQPRLGPTTRAAVRA